MAKKNDLLIANMKRVQREINNILPNVYAGIALALHRKHGWGYKRINDLFIESEKLWYEATDNNINMVALCLEETGIEVQGVKNGKL